MPDGTYFWLCKTFSLCHNYWHSMKTVNNLSEWAWPDGAHVGLDLAQVCSLFTPDPRPDQLTCPAPLATVTDSGIVCDPSQTNQNIPWTFLLKQLEKLALQLWRCICIALYMRIVCNKLGVGGTLMEILSTPKYNWEPKLVKSSIQNRFTVFRSQFCLSWMCDLGQVI